MNTKHTAGQWLTVQHSQFCNGTEIVCNGKVITTILNQRATDIEGKANARLMAAAPELLEMCIATLEDLESGELVGNAKECALINLRKAIQKAI